MRYAFESQGINDARKLGGLFFEVKIIEGFLLDQSSSELIGFVDLDNDNDVNKTSSSLHEKLATHVLQFHFKSFP